MLRQLSLARGICIERDEPSNIRNQFVGHGEIMFPGVLQGEISFDWRIPPSIHTDRDHRFDSEFDIDLAAHVAMCVRA